MSDIPLSTLGIVLFILIILSGFFSSSETGLIALNRYRLRHLAKQGNRAAKMAQKLLEQPDRVIGLILLGNNLVNVSASTIATLIGLRLMGDNGPIVAAVILTIIILIFSEVTPKTLAAYHPEKIAFPAAFVLTPMLKIFYPLVWLISGISRLLLKPFGIQTRSDLLQELSREEIRTLLTEDGDLPNEHQRMLVNILDLEYAKVDDVIIPRNDIIGIDLNDSWEDILQRLSNSVYTRLPVYRGELENVVGLLHVRTLISKLSRGQLVYDDVVRSVRKPYFIPEGTSLTQQLLEFQSRDRRMALVVDEYGDIQGLVTLDDILEEIVGEYTSDPNERSRIYRKLEDGNFLVDGSAAVRSLNRRLNWSLPTDGGRTINGLLLEELEAIPQGNTSLKIDNYIVTILGTRDNIIQRVLIKPPTAESG
ncbi:MAG: HlyC/CorC family transporter [Xanthomonadales bacterium]|nr:HlyC/CorC family transporter [Xanthomonadales bacterium]